MRLIHVISVAPEKFVIEYMPHGDLFNAIKADAVDLDECVG